MTKDTTTRVVMTILLIIALFEGLLITLGIDVINDLKATANGCKSDKAVCEGKLDSITQDYERLQVNG